MDIPTLYAVFAGILMVSCAALVIAWRENPHGEGQKSWAMGACAGALSTLAFSATALSSSLYWLNALVNPIAWLAVVLFARGARQYAGLVATPRWMWGFFTISALTPIAVWAGMDSPRGLTLSIGSLVAAVFCFDVVYALGFRLKKKSPASYFLVFFFGVWGVTHLTRLVMTAGDLFAPTYTRPIDQIMVLVGILGAAASAMGFAMLTTRALRDARARNLEELERSVEHLRGQFAALAAGDYSVRAEPLGTSQHMDAIAGLFNDTVTQIGLAQAQLQMNDRLAAMGTVAAGVAHEINNPLSFVASNIEFVLEELEDKSGVLEADDLAEVLSALAAANTGSDRIRKIVRDLKRFTRSSEETEGLADVNQLITSAASMLENEVRHHAKVSLELTEIPAVRGDDAKLGQVFLNLVHNAAQAIPPGHVSENLISVRSFADSRGVVVEVEDSGCGISSDKRKRIFEAFYTTKPVGVGTGLGLAICHRVVTDLGGDIEVESEEGRGSVFRVVLPPAAHVAKDVSTGTVAGGVPSTPRRKILVIDDEVEVGRSVMRTLGRQHHVDAVSAAVEGLKQIESNDYDVILCDLMMPEMTGMELCRELEGRHPEAAERTIFMSGGVFSPDAEAFVQDPQRRVLNKPLDRDALRRLVAEVSAGRDDAEQG